ncbi:Na+/H+ antiporter NhaC family protein [Lentibacillus amyloliquefaciens]|uniref:Sodium:proton antiporter n=1 Tax=Lentibacillus amyloliquefaciens TaxID=1472767 RepID=A0A0U3W9H3_9BACI|nr:Na+/H+ antiporter NhaC family protein [Lentibacillus amyloliquefaciens]ALX49682.1 sodium:proton antiporter [Lentibacillus amyloliquefaciens]
MDWLSLIPFVIVIGLSIWLKKILPGLVLGVLVGGILTEFSILTGTQKSVDYIVTTLSDANNIKIVAFLYLFGGLIGMMRISGGIKGFSEWIGDKIESQRGLLSLIWLTLPFTFMMPMFRIMMIGPVVKSLMKDMSIPKRKVGFTMDVSTSSVIVLLPVATAFVGFMVSLVESGVQKYNLNMDPYHIFLLSILFNFFAIVMLIIGLIRTFWSRGDKERVKEQTAKGQDDKHDYHRSGIEKELSTVKAQPWNLIVPLFLLLGLTLFLLWQDGKAKGADTFFQAFSEGDATFVMLLGVFVTLILTFVFYMIRRQSMSETIYHFYDGGNQLMQAIVLLILVWALSLVTEDLGFSQFINATLGSFLPAFTIPAIVFVLGAVVSYFIGSSWGTWGIIMPLGMALAISTGASIPLTVGAVFASGSFGAMTSPLGDTTITTASILEMPLVDYARYKLKFCSVGAGIAAVIYVGAGFLLG